MSAYEAEIWPPIEGTAVLSHAVIVQMSTEALIPPATTADELIERVENQFRCHGLNVV